MIDIGNSYGRFVRDSADLCSFVRVCHLGKLSAAAKDLNVTQPSLSQRIKNLELALGRQLFVRKSTGVDMTAEGHALYQLLSEPLELAATRYSEFIGQPKPDQVTLSVDHAFASFWLSERLPQLREELGLTDICIVTSQDPWKIQGAEPDIRVFGDTAGTRNTSAQLIFPEQVSAICSAAFLEEYSDIREPDDLIRLAVPLLHLNSPVSQARWIDWPQWFEKVGVRYNRKSGHFEFNSYEMVVQAACRGQGAALGWHVLTDRLVAEQKLLHPVPQTVKTGAGYYVQLSNSGVSKKATKVMDWIMDQTASARS